MAGTVQTVIGVNSVKGAEPEGNLEAFMVAVKSKGTYLTATKPVFDFLAAMQATRQGVSAVAVKSAVAFRDYNDGAGNVYTASNAVIALSSTGNKLVTWTVESGATNGDTGTEISDAVALDGVFTFLVVAAITKT